MELDTEVGEDLNDAYGLMEGIGQVYAVSPLCGVNVRRMY